jgi:hypothetical protein
VDGRCRVDGRWVVGPCRACALTAMAVVLKAKADTRPLGGRWVEGAGSMGGGWVVQGLCAEGHGGRALKARADGCTAAGRNVRGRCRVDGRSWREVRVGCSDRTRFPARADGQGRRLHGRREEGGWKVQGR